MSSAEKKVTSLKSTTTAANSQSLLETIKGRTTSELVIGVCGPIGSGATLVANTIAQILEEYSYKTELIKISKLAAESSLAKEKKIPSSPYTERVQALQDLGDSIRGKYGSSALAQLACIKISDTRTDFFSGNPETIESARIAYIIDSLKHPDEVRLLRQVYRNAFFLVGIESPESLREKRLASKGLDSSPEFTKLSIRDADDSEKKHGQKVSSTVELSDIFLRNDGNTNSQLKEKLKRYIAIILGSGIQTPTIHEMSMYNAYAASARSACLSRQVGAAIISETGELLATGANDVPKVGGGLYTSEAVSDERCFNRGGKCYNDFHKDRLYDEVIDKLNKAELLVKDKEVEVKRALKGTRIQGLIEFSRAVHAEMEAIVSLARKPNASSVGATLYCTTFPCHSCARHIVSAGIKTVYYIEPYAKSLATDLHDDAISIAEGEEKKIRFLPYEGVSPNRYLVLFRINPNQPRKIDGLLVRDVRSHSNPKDSLPLDDFRDVELKVIKEAKEKGLVTAGV